MSVRKLVLRWCGLKKKKKSHTKQSLLIGNNVGSSVSKPAATIGIIAVKILSRQEKRENITCKDYVRSVLLSHVLLGHVILHRSRVLIFQITGVRKPSQTNSSLTSVLFLIHVDQPQISSEEETERRQWSRCSPQCSAHH